MQVFVLQEGERVMSFLEFGELYSILIEKETYFF